MTYMLREGLKLSYLQLRDYYLHIVSSSLISLSITIGIFHYVGG